MKALQAQIRSEPANAKLRVFLFQLLASLLARPEQPAAARELLSNPFFAVHVSLALVAYAANRSSNA